MCRGDVKQAPDDLKNKTLSVLDTGTSLGFMSQYYWDAIYKDIPGIKTYNESQALYTVPCESKRNVSVIFR